MTNPLGGFGLGLGGDGFGLGGGNGLGEGFKVGRAISFGPGGVKTGGFGPIGGFFPLFGK